MFFIAPWRVSSKIPSLSSQNGGRLDNIPYIGFPFLPASLFSVPFPLLLLGTTSQNQPSSCQRLSQAALPGETWGLKHSQLRILVTCGNLWVDHPTTWKSNPWRWKLEDRGRPNRSSGRIPHEQDRRGPIVTATFRFDHTL